MRRDVNLQLKYIELKERENVREEYEELIKTTTEVFNKKHKIKCNQENLNASVNAFSEA